MAGRDVTAGGMTAAERELLVEVARRMLAHQEGRLLEESKGPGGLDSARARELFDDNYALKSKIDAVVRDAEEAARV